MAMLGYGGKALLVHTVGSNNDGYSKNFYISRSSALARRIVQKLISSNA